MSRTHYYKIKREGEREREAGREGEARAKPGNQLVLIDLIIYFCLFNYAVYSSVLI